MSHLSRAAQKIWAQGLETHEDQSPTVNDATSLDAAELRSIHPIARSGPPYLTYSSAAPLQPQSFQFASPEEDGSSHVAQRSTRPLSGQNAPIGASRSRPSTAGRISSATPITDAAIQRGVNVPTYRPAATKAAAEALGLQVQASAKGSVETPRPASSSARRPPSASPSTATATARPTSASFQPTNSYGQPASAYASDEKDSTGSTASLHARMIASAAAHRPAFVPSRPTSSSGFYSSSGASRSRPSSAVANLAFGQAAPSAAHKPGKMPASARGMSRGNIVDCYDPHKIITVHTAKETDAEEQRRHDRSSGLLLTTRARPAFSARFDPSGHSTFPLSASALRPNAGFHSELMVSHERLLRFQDSCAAEEKHFYSKNLFWEYKLTELLRATEEEQAASANGKDILRTTVEGSQTDRPQSGKRNNTTAKIQPVSDAMYPSTYRTLCASAILKQVVPTLLTPPLPKSMASPAANASTALNGKGPTKATKELLALTLSILHRSIYQPPSTLTPPNPHAHSIDSDLGDGFRSAEDLDAFEGVEERLSERVKRLRAVQGSGYAQAAINAVGKTVSSSASDPAHTRSSSTDETMEETMSRAMSHEGQGKLIDGMTAQKIYDTVEDNSSAHAFQIPYFLSTRYLYESVQSTQRSEELREEKVRRIERQIGKMEQKATRRVCRVTFHIWRAYVKLQKQKANLNVFLTSKGLARRTKMEPELIFHM